MIDRKNYYFQFHVITVKLTARGLRKNPMKGKQENNIHSVGMSENQIGGYSMVFQSNCTLKKIYDVQKHFWSGIMIASTTNVLEGCYSDIRMK
mmetsp:Transcript_20577/g.41784  ORF Transcript_20577/g.41784 Transcript_20577/m.41784 type:complete len:93 (+) Transcript_20577:3-281(+)